MTAADWTEITGPADIRLVVADMDGTLLDEHSQIPSGFWPMLERLQSRGVEFVPASGRQYATLRSMFADRVPRELSYIAENGNVVVADGELIEVHGVDVAVSRAVVDMVDTAVANGTHDIGLVLCGLNTAYIQRTDPAFVDECRKYYHALEIVPDLHAVLPSVERGDETMLKLAIFDFGDAESMAGDLLGDIARDWQVVVSGAHWVDIMNPQTDKRRGVEALQRHLNVAPAQTAVFGDYLNDLEMLSAGEYSFAMSNAHPDLKAAAHYIAPTNVDHGVLTVVDRLIG
ncbi:Cof-type HAD-IIB family hydrolase [Bifidobacterium aerophilum]|uniref:Cof-type HAD-IIB family hydrolase n=1 Tax=Bifidobacterium aerophilum TaxID=1798155 RepID=A0A6N9Z5R6_9BIFI|nr:Cof-type HAD-IIB family hydrolase [Bifidobacterium aerophilum]NEG89776.1 Cof-type HAD-IIB family hydrolase [Bifidobacterium aerophilum]